LIEALDRVLENAGPELQHEIVRERVSISEAIQRIAERLAVTPRLSFFELFDGQRTRQQLVNTFLAMLEMVKLKLVRIFQEEGSGEIVLAPKGAALSNLNAPEVDESEYR
jgi:segregation and condensation protein A